MIIRVLMGLVVAPIASVGALYGLSMVVEPTPGVYGAPGETSAINEEEPMGEPPLALPYENGQAAAFLADDVPVKLLALRDGGYEIALGPERIGRARRALARWRREGFVGIEARLSSGAAYLSRVEPPGPESR